jgi:hypothetical protein
MFTFDNLDQYFQLGKLWPPESDADRIKIYDQNLQLYRNEHEKVYTVLTKLYADNETNYNKVLMKLNWHKQISTFWADMLFSEKPKITAGAEGSAEQEYLKELIKRVNFWKVAYSLAVDTSRYGAGIPKIYAVEGEAAKLQSLSPKNWFPVIGPDNQIAGHVLAWIINQTLYVEIHSTGLIASYQFMINENGRINSGPIDSKEVKTGYDEALVFPILNSETSDDVYGRDDYQDLDPLIKRLDITFTRNGRILDAHSEPAFAVPDDALGPKDPVTGERSYSSKRRIFPIEAGSPLPQYITWDGQLTAAFTLIDKVMNQFYAISKTCRVAFEPDSLGNQISGKALRMLMTRPLKNAERLKLCFDPQLKSILRALSYLDVQNGVKGAIHLDDIDITWYDGLPNDFSESVRDLSLLKSQNAISDDRMQNMLFDLEGENLTNEVAKLQQITAAPPAY